MRLPDADYVSIPLLRLVNVCGNVVLCVGRNAAMTGAGLLGRKITSISTAEIVVLERTAFEREPKATIGKLCHSPDGKNLQGTAALVNHTIAAFFLFQIFEGNFSHELFRHQASVFFFANVAEASQKLKRRNGASGPFPQGA
ncbi:MAG: hypothetical protein Q8R12_02815 [bacterium]|nr:hypothetical protein [bacterium]